jgi:wyosine [tRNA(Phe)-imidazoG37] synthetase (radical SAM superfamily)
VDEVLEAVRYAFKKPRTIEYLTFSGNGEPTLHPDFEEIVQRVVLLRNELRPDTKLAILSNASQIVEPKILLAIQNYDTPMMKLDAGDEVTFNIINRPTENVHFSEIVSGLKKLPNLMIQSMLLDGDESNTRGDAFLAWKNLLVELQPKLIHIYTITRPTAYNGINAVSFSRLKEIAHDLNSSYGLNVIAFD